MSTSTNGTNVPQPPIDSPQKPNRQCPQCKHMWHAASYAEHCPNCGYDGDCKPIDRYVCQFRKIGTDYFLPEASFPAGDLALRHMVQVMTAIPFIAAGQVFDRLAGEFVSGATMQRGAQ